MKNSPLLRGVDSKHKVLRRRGVSRVIYVRTDIKKSVYYLGLNLLIGWSIIISQNSGPYQERSDFIPEFVPIVYQIVVSSVIGDQFSVWRCRQKFLTMFIRNDSVSATMNEQDRIVV